MKKTKPTTRSRSKKALEDLSPKASPKGGNVAMGDGSVRFVQPTTSASDVYVKIDFISPQKKI